MIKNTKHVTTNFSRVREIDWFSEKVLNNPDIIIPEDEWIVTIDNIKSHDIAIYVDHKKAKISFITNKKRVIKNNESYFNHKDILNKLSPKYDVIINNIDNIFKDIKYKNMVIFGKINELTEDFKVNDIALINQRTASKSKSIRNDIILFQIMKEDNLDEAQYNYIDNCINSLEGRINSPYKFLLSYDDLNKVLEGSNLVTNDIVFRSNNFKEVCEYKYDFNKDINNIVIRSFNKNHYIKNGDRFIFKVTNPIYNEKIIKANKLSNITNKITKYSDIVINMIELVRDEYTSKSVFKNVLNEYTQKDFNNTYYLPVKLISQFVLNTLKDKEADSINKIKILNEYNIFKKMVHNIVLTKYKEASYIYNIYNASDIIEKNDSKKFNKKSVIECIDDVLSIDMIKNNHINYITVPTNTVINKK